jgi:hypothetical protein
MDDRDLDQPVDMTDEELAAQQEAARRAEIDAHPHNQLTRMAAQLTAPAANQADVNTRLAHLHSVVRQLIQLMRGMIPPPEEPNGEVLEQRQPVEGSVEQEPVRDGQ